MAHKPAYRRVVLKITGESLSGPGGECVDSGAVEAVANELRPVVEMDVEVALVIGGGNILRGRDLRGNPHVQRVTADYMGMLATVMNAVALGDSLNSLGIDCRVMSAIAMPAVCEPYTRARAIRHLEKGLVVVLAGGTGSPFVSTDTCAALRASELGAQAVLKATKVDGVFDSDPMVNPAAKRYDRLTYDKVLADRLGVMDLTAISMCMENRLPVIVFAFSQPGNLARVIRGENVGTVVGA